MSTRRTPFHLLAALILAAFTVVIGCGRTPGPPAPPVNESTPTAVTARTYVVRARLVRIQSRARPLQLDIEHEAIPDLVGPSGEVEGMHSMVMPFPLAEGVSLNGLAAGDLIEVDLRIDWEADRPAVITAVRGLPAGTQLALD